MSLRSVESRQTAEICQFIQNFGHYLRFPVRVVATAMVFYHKFAVRHSWEVFGWENLVRHQHATHATFLLYSCFLSISFPLDDKWNFPIFLFFSKAVACLYASAKAEDVPRKLEDVLEAFFTHSDKVPIPATYYLNC